MIERLNAHIAQTSADYETRGQVILDQQATIERIESERRESLTTIERLNREVDALKDDHARDRVMLEQRDVIEDFRRDVAQLIAESEAQRRLIVERQAVLEGLRSDVGRLTAESEAQLRVIADQHATIDKLIHQRDYTGDVESRLRDVDAVHLALSTLLQSRLVRLLRALRLV